MDNNKQIQKGFNAGYLLAKHQPVLLQTLKNGLQKNDDPYVQGLLAGSEEYAKEMGQPSKSKPLARLKGKPHQNYGFKKPKGRVIEKPGSEKDKDGNEHDLDMDI